MNHMRDMLDAKDWLIVQDTQSQREILEGQCIQLIVHFYGNNLRFYFTIIICRDLQYFNFLNK